MSDAIEAVDLRRSFGNFEAVRGLNLRVPAGQIYGLLGPNGSGKTTTIRMIAGLLRPSNGRLRVMGDDPTAQPIRRQVGYMTQAAALYPDLSVRENVGFFAALFGPRDSKRIAEVIDLVELGDKRDEIVANLSGGMKQRASLAAALVHRPRLLLLDEPTVGVDPQLRRQFWDYFRRLAGEGVTIVVSSHVMDEAERCDTLGLMRNGTLLAEGTPAEIRARAQVATTEEAFLVLSEA
jgi:ABC-2 type transport system ATP-binding protein